jgi:hypothetical protein
MNLSAWRAQKRGQLTLPSGLEVTLNKVTLEDLVLSGDIPAPLLREVMALYESGAFQTGDMNPASPEMWAILDKIPEAMKMFDAVTRAALVSPAVADVADDDHITTAELSLKDKEAIFNWAAAGANALAPFRAE